MRLGLGVRAGEKGQRCAVAETSEKTVKSGRGEGNRRVVNVDGDI